MDTGNLTLLNNQNKSASKFTRVKIINNSKFDENWLQEKIYSDPSLLEVIDPNYEKIKIIPLCREFSLHNGVSNVFLDILAITETGKLILVECKLWKNPQARREVIAQIVEYATLLKSLSYSDFSTRLKKFINSEDEDPITHIFKRFNINFDEAQIIDRISESLKSGRFHLVIAGDGIRSDLINITNTINQGSFFSDLTLLEICIYENDNKDIILLPKVPSKTEIVTKTVITSSDGSPMTIEEDVNEDRTDGTGINYKRDEIKKESNREFWSKIIKEIKIEHPDQEPPRHGGNNWIKLPLPSPLKWVTAYRARDNTYGVFIRFAIDEEADELYQFLESNMKYFKDEIDQSISLQYTKDKKSNWDNGIWLSINTRNTDIDLSTYELQKDWIQKNVNGFTNALRGILNRFKDELSI